MKHHLAQINISRFKAPLDDASMKEFVDFLEPVNKLAEESEGFIWRLKDDSGQPSSYMPSPFEDNEMTAINMSVWVNIEAFKNYVYNSVHSYFLKNKKKWFSPIDRPHTVMWWIKKGEIPTTADGKRKLDYFKQHGSSPDVFTFHEIFDPQGNRIT